VSENNSNIESVMFKVIDILNNNNIDYWLTDGTLLGIIRENRILPWDLDIDIGIWKSDTPITNLINLFEKNGFKYIERLPDINSLHFIHDKYMIDINMYSQNENEVFTKWASNPKGFFDRIFVKVVNSFFETQQGNQMLKENNLINYIKKIVGLLGRNLPKSTLKKAYAYARKKYDYKGCVYPIELLKSTKMIFKGRELIVPIESHEYLALTYGDNWKIPNKDYNWEEDTKNLNSL